MTEMATNQKKEEEKETWMTKNGKYLWAIPIGLISVAGALVLYFMAIPFGISTVLSATATNALITAEATVLGFFGIIAVYLLTSYDSRIDKLEEQIFDAKDDKDRSETLEKRQDDIRTKKKWALLCMVPGLGCLIISLLLSIFTYGILSIVPDPIYNATQIATLQANQIKYTVWPSITSALLLFISIVAIFLMLIWIGTEPRIGKLRRSNTA
jgi:uncharacterized BrkB/YihY/UPF0761 family membrane protein